MAVDVAGSSDRRDLLDRVDHPLWVLGRGGNQQHGVVIDSRSHRSRVGAPIVAHGHASVFDAEVVAALLERSVGTRRQNDVRVGDAALDAPAFAGGLDRHQQALRAAAGEKAGSLLATLGPFGHHGQHFLLDAPQAGEGTGVESVLAGEQAVSLLGDGQHIVTPVIHEGEDAALAPAHVVAAIGREALEYFVLGEPVWRQ